MKVASVTEAKAQLSALIEAALQGEEIVITRAGRAVVRLAVIEREPEPRNLRLALWEGEVEFGDDFDAPLPEPLLNAFEGAP